MIEKLAQYVVSWQIRKHYMPKDKERIYIYAYELLIGQAVNLLIACLLAVIFHDYITVVVYLAAYIPLRSYAGGHHADSYEVCTVVSAVLICAACILIKLIPLSDIWIVNIAGALMSSCVIFLLAPVQDHNKPLDQKEKSCYRRFSIGIWLIETLLWIICYVFGAKLVSLAIVLSHISISGMLVAGIVKNKRILQVK